METARNIAGASLAALLLIGTWGGGAFRYHNGTFTQYAKGKELRDDRVTSIVVARDGTVWFGSEIRSVAAALPVPPDVDPVALNLFLRYRYTPSPLTIFKGIRKLRPGHTLTIEHGRVRERRYWDIQFTPNRARKESDILEELTARIDEAVRIRLISDVPLGAFLSGGIDSSAVVAFMAKAGGSTPVKTFIHPGGHEYPTWAPAEIVDFFKSHKQP